MAAAARLQDPIGHSPTMSWLVTGLLAGAAIGLGVALVCATGGLAAVAMVGAGAAGGAGIMEMASTLSPVDKEVVGAITATGAANVFINGLAAARAHLDFASCSKHPAPATLAEGSGTVHINSQPAARVDDKTICSAVITKGSGNVFIGGPTQQTDVIEAENLVPEWVHVSLLVVGVGSALVLAPVAVVAVGLGAGALGYVGGDKLGGHLFGEGSDGQKLMAFGFGTVAGLLGGKGAQSWLASRANKPPPVVRDGDPELPPPPKEDGPAPDAPDPEPPKGRVEVNQLEPHEAAFADDIVAAKGGFLEGAPTRSYPGIDGTLDGVPISLKETQGGLGAVLKHASKAESQAGNAGYTGVDLYVKAPNVSAAALRDFAANGPLSSIPNQGKISNIHVLTKDGWVHIGGGN